MPSKGPPVGFYDDLAPSPAPSAAAGNTHPGPSPAAARRAAFYDDLGPRPAEVERKPDRAADQRREAFEAQRTARQRAFYGDDPGTAPAKPPPAAAVQALDLEAPEGIDANDPVFSDFKQATAELGLDPKGAGRLLELHQRALQAEADGWRKAAEADSDVMAAVPAARSLVNEFGTPALMTLLDSGLGDHPEVIRLLGMVSKELERLRSRR